MGLCAVMNRCAAVEGGAEGGEERIGEREEEDSTQMGEEELEVDCSWMHSGFHGSPSDCCLDYHAVHSQPPDLLHFEEVFERYGDLGRHDGVDCSWESV